MLTRLVWVTSAFSSLSTALLDARQVQSPPPYASPTGLSDDITQWLAVTSGSQIATARSKMLANINIAGAAPGTVVAATSTENPNYHYNWVRDAALTMDVVVRMYATTSDPTAIANYEQLLFEYAQARATEQNDPNLQTGLGEPKFELNNSVFTGPWGRPQNDGPAESSTTLMEFANAYLSKGGNWTTVNEKIWNSNTFGNQAPVLKDLLFVATTWTAPSFDLWEEESSDHFFNRMVYHRALSAGAAFATRLNDTNTASTLSTAADAVAGSLPGFWDPNRQLIVYEIGPVLHNKASYKDIAVVLAVLHGYNSDSIFSYSNDQVLVSAYEIATSFLSVYPIANVTVNSSGGILGIPIGRYPEDVYDGVGTAVNGGNPWFLATAAMAELFYRAAIELRTGGSLTATNTSMPFWEYFAPAAQLTIDQQYSSSDAQFAAALSGLEGWGDAFMRRIKYHTPADKRLTEEYDRYDGFVVGATDLTWSYAAFLTASFARASLMNDTAYITSVADLP